jgi:hypothetical protein
MIQPMKCRRKGIMAENLIPISGTALNASLSFHECTKF